MANLLEKIKYWLLKKLYIIIGLIIFIIGLFTAPLPIPLGLPLMVMGGVILLRNSSWAKRGYIRIKQFIKTNLSFLNGFWHRFDHLLRYHKFQYRKKPSQSQPMNDE
jgi:hypothetical protein